MGSEWPAVRLIDYCIKIGSGATPKGGNSVYLDDGDIYLIRSQNIYNDNFNSSGLVFITEDAALKLKNVVVEENDILLNITGDSVARVCLAPTAFLPARVNQHVLIIRPDFKEFDARFIRYFLASPYQQQLLLNLASSGATRNALTKSMIENFEVPKPSLEIQRTISVQLEALDNKIQLNRETNKTLEAMAQALFKSWFVDFDPVIDNALAAGNKIPEPFQARAAARKAALAGLPKAQRALFPSEFEETEELGWVPKGWGIGTLMETVDLIGGGTPKTTIEEYWNGSIPWFSVVDAPNDSDVYVIDTEKYVTDLGVEKSSTKILRKGTTIISARGTVGKCALVAQPMAMNQSCYGIQGREGFPDEYVYYLIRCRVSDLQQRGHGSVFNTITRDTFESILSPLPSEPALNKFSELVQSIFNKILSNGKQKIELEKLRDTLLPKLISGELRLPDAEKQAEASR